MKKWIAVIMAVLWGVSLLTPSARAAESADLDQILFIGIVGGGSIGASVGAIIDAIDNAEEGKTGFKSTLTGAAIGAGAGVVLATIGALIGPEERRVEGESALIEVTKGRIRLSIPMIDIQPSLFRVYPVNPLQYTSLFLLVRF